MSGMLAMVLILIDLDFSVPHLLPPDAEISAQLMISEITELCRKLRLRLSILAGPRAWVIFSRPPCMMTTTSAPPHTSSIDETTIKKVAGLKVLDFKKEEVQFGSLFEDQQTIVIFVRHFFCGSCQAYITQLCKIVSDEALKKAGTHVVLIGSGEPEAFDHFREMTGFKGDIYTNPSRDIFRALGMTATTQTTPEGQTRKSYLTLSKRDVVLNSLWDIAKKPYLFFAKTGNLSQNGGELILGPGLQCSFSSIMQHSEDHTELADLMRVAGVEVET